MTINPSLDISTTVDAVVSDHKLRCAPPTRAAGGGGVNVARVARRLGAEVVAVMITAGANGSLLTSLLDSEGVPSIAIDTEGETRQSLTVADQAAARHYRFVLPGPVPDPAAVDRLIETVGSLSDIGVVVISGSLPPGTKAGTLTRLADGVSEPGRPVLIDTSGPALAEALNTKVALVKPSARELSLVSGVELLTEADILTTARQTMSSSSVGAILVSVGPGGAILITADGAATRFRAPAVRVASAVGAGDSLVAGIGIGVGAGQDLISAIPLGIAAGAAAVMTPGSELCHPEQVAKLVDLVRVE